MAGWVIKYEGKRVRDRRAGGGTERNETKAKLVRPALIDSHSERVAINTNANASPLLFFLFFLFYSTSLSVASFSYIL